MQAEHTRHSYTMLSGQSLSRHVFRLKSWPSLTTLRLPLRISSMALNSTSFWIVSSPYLHPVNHSAKHKKPTRTHTHTKKNKKNIHQSSATLTTPTLTLHCFSPFCQFSPVPSISVLLKRGLVPEVLNHRGAINPQVVPQKLRAQPDVILVAVVAVVEALLHPVQLLQNRERTCRKAQLPERPLTEAHGAHKYTQKHTQGWNSEHTKGKHCNGNKNKKQKQYNSKQKKNKNEREQQDSVESAK